MKKLILLLLVISVIGFVISFAVHFLSLFHIYNPSKELTMILYIGILIVIYPAILATKKIKSEIGKDKMKDFMSKVCPKWMTISLGFLIMYLIVQFGYLIITRISRDSEIADVAENPETYNGFPAQWMVFYALGAVLLYSYLRSKYLDRKDDRR